MPSHILASFGGNFLLQASTFKELQFCVFLCAAVLNFFSVLLRHKDSVSVQTLSVALFYLISNISCISHWHFNNLYIVNSSLKAYRTQYYPSEFGI